jgi:phosphatidylinositol-bisphosphatase
MAPSVRNSVDQDPLGPESPLQTSSPHSLSRAVFARKAEYVRPRKIKVKIGTWNVAACPGTEKDLAGWFVRGKGMDKRVTGMSIEESEIPDNLEGVAEQKQRHATIPKGDKGVVANGDDIDLYVLGLQEVVELSSAKEYIGRVIADPGPITKWRNALIDALPPRYVSVAEQQLSGLLLLIFASPEVAPTISSVSTVSVGTGIMGYLGNKGAVTTRIVLGETTRLVFVNCHLASGVEVGNLERRCWDASQVLQRTLFDPIDWAGVLDDKQESIGDEDFAFWFGDLNFRLDGLPGDDIRRLLMLHAREGYDIEQERWNKVDGVVADNEDVIIIKPVESDDESELESPQRANSAFENNDDTSSMTLPDPDDFVQDPSQDPTSLQAIIDSLLPHDQLRRVQKTKKAFHDGWREGPITFLPTYKYDVGSMGIFDSSEKQRAPSWCDRILFRTRRDKLEYDGKFQAQELIRIKDEEMKARGIDSVQDDEDVLFDYNPEEDGTQEGEAVEEPETAKDFFDAYDEGEDAEEVVAKEDFVDKIHLDVYTTHQRVLSSDHKPVNAIFTLEYDAVVPELRSIIQAEVARELDRAENEGRPGITVVVDRSQDVEHVPRTKSQKSLTGGTDGVNFGPVSFLQRVRRSVTIANTSQVNSSFMFLERPGEPGNIECIAPSWLSVRFDGFDLDEDSRNAKGLKRETTLEPGDTVNATLELFMDDVSSIKALNDGMARLDDVLVLRVTDGRDHFIPIRGSWLQSCCGRSVDELIRVPEGGVRALPPLPEGEVGGVINGDLKICLSAPRELFKLTEAVESLTERCIADVNVREDLQFPQEAPGWPFDEKSWLLKDSIAREVHKVVVLDALDLDKNLNDAFPPDVPTIEKIEILAEVLLMWLGSLTDGIIPGVLWTQLENDMNTRGAKQLSDVEEIKTWVLDVLSSSPNHNISFVFLTSMLKRLAAEFAPLPKIGWKESIGRGGLNNIRQSLSWKGKGQYVLNDKEVLRRQAQERAYAEVFSNVVFRGPAPGKEKEKRVVNERRRYILEAFLHGGV